jgi:hypothetical protein
MAADRNATAKDRRAPAISLCRSSWTDRPVAIALVCRLARQDPVRVENPLSRSPGANARHLAAPNRAPAALGLNIHTGLLHLCRNL